MGFAKMPPRNAASTMVLNAAATLSAFDDGSTASTTVDGRVAGRDFISSRSSTRPARVRRVGALY